MSTINYIIGESGTVGFPIDQPDGTPMPLDGLSIRLVVYLRGADLIIPGYAASGPFMFPDGTVRDHPSIAAFDFSAELPLFARLYPCAVQISTGTLFATVEGHNHYINARRP